MVEHYCSVKSAAECETRRVTYSTLVVGSLAALRTSIDDETMADLPAEGDVVVLPTAAAFTGSAEASLAVVEALEGTGLRLEALMVTDRASADEPYFVQRIAEADLVVLCDGAALHARTVWRATPVGEALRAARRLVAVGAVASVLGEVMIDPRGGAPTTGLGWRLGLVVSAPASDDLLDRTRALLQPVETLVVLGPMGVLAHDGARWHVLVDDVIVTRGHDHVIL
jgi:hypothetical protein